ncbi:Hypothetical protein NocV09_01900120 [Nannochloropsis oceanica]
MVPFYPTTTAITTLVLRRRAAPFPSIATTNTVATRLAVATGTNGAIPFAATLTTGLHASPWWVWSMLLLASTAGVAAERSKVGAALSSPLITMAVALVVCNLGLLPAVAPAYATVNKFLVPLAIPLLLLDANLFKVLTQTGRLLRSFALGSIGTVLGTLVAAWLVPLRNLGVDGKEGWTIAAALASRHIGGAVNFVAVSETLATSAELTAAGIAADNLVVSFYFGLLFWLARRILPEEEEEEGQGGGVAGEGEKEEWVGRARVIEAADAPALGYLKALSLSCVLCMVGTWVGEGLLSGAISSLPIISLLSVTIATLFPRACASITEPAGHLAVILMNLFFSVTGAQGKLGKVLATAPRLFLFSAVQLFVHLAFLLGAGRGLFRLPFKELLIASNANVGGPTTAAAMAGSKKWKSLVLPGILTGILGYASATFIGLVLGRRVLAKMMMSSVGGS